MKRIKITSILIAFCFISKFSIGQQLPTEKSLLWKISGNGLEKPSYLYGTIHVICPEELEISAPAIKAFYDTEQLFLELDMDDSLLTSQMQKSMTSSTHLRYLMKEKEYKKIAKFFKKRVGYSIDLLGMIKPFYLLSFTYSPMIGCNQPISVESYFMKLAEKRKLEINGLETLQDQMAIFDNIPQKEQAKMLFHYVNDFDKMQITFHQMLQIYKAQDLDALMEISNKTNQHADKYEQFLLDNRNKKWLNTIVNQICEKPTFIAVGAAHLTGENGLLNLLRKGGYSITASIE